MLDLTRSKVLKSRVNSGNVWIDFGDKEEVRLDNTLPSDVVESNKVLPSSWWRSWFHSKDNGGEEAGSSTVINEKVIRSHLNHLYVRHFLLEDLEAEPANTEALDYQARMHGVADIPYNFPKYDCGDRSFACMGAWHLDTKTAAMATYIVWVTYVSDGENVAHALNACCTDKEFLFYEPATYTFFSLPDFWMINVLMG
jgi:hypothetical protein